MTSRIAVVDTTFAAVDMGGIVVRTLQASAAGVRIERATVPGVKDLGVACKRMLDAGCDIAIACGMPGPEPIDKASAQVASIGLQYAMMLTNKHIVEVFVHMDEARSGAELDAVCRSRCSEHAVNALALLKGPTALTAKAGTGQRQGHADVGPAAQLQGQDFRPKGHVATADAKAAPSSTSGSNAGKH